MKWLFSGTIGILLLCIVPDWGFFGHRTINEIACYTLPQELFAFYKPNVAYIKAHAVDPDMRRYALKKEAGRHYIDIDHWGKPPFDVLPRRWPEAFFAMLDISYVNSNADTISVKKTRQAAPDTLVQLFYPEIMPHYFDESWTLTCEQIQTAYPQIQDCQSIVAHDSLTDFGILPYGLMYTYRQLTRAYESKSPERILRHAADLGHYIADGHVPLHTTVNYNGQLTNQEGIHAFWESRLPELFAMDQYDLFTGKAQYINDVHSYFWKFILEAHTMVDSVLLIEKRLKETFPSDQQICFEERLNRTVSVPCQEFAKAYHEALDGMVEEQMIKSIEAVGNIWYSAWVDAGQPVLTDIQFGTITVDLDSIELEYQDNKVHH